MTVAQGNTLKVVATLTMPGTTIAQNVFYCTLTSASTEQDDDVIEACRLWVEEMYDHVFGEISDVISMNEISVYKKIGTLPLVYDLLGIVAGTGAGTEVTDPLPNGVALVIRAGTAVAGTIARKYIPGFAELASAGPAWTATVLIDAVAFAVDWVSGPDTFMGATYDGGVVSSKDGLFKPFTAAALISTIPGYQRRRKPGVGV